MNAAQRREKILEQLHGASAPISASALAAKLGSAARSWWGRGPSAGRRGRNRGHPARVSVPPDPGGYTGILACVHRTADEMRTELYTVVDQEAWWSMWRWKTRFTASCGAT